MLCDTRSPKLSVITLIISLLIVFLVYPINFEAYATTYPWARSQNAPLFSQDIKFAPSDSSIVFAAYRDSTASGLFRSVDAGRSFEVNFDLQSGRDVNGIAISYSNEDKLCISTYEQGVFCTSDGGINFSNAGWLNSGLSGIRARYVAVDPRNDEIYYAGTGESGGDGGIYKTTNSGNSWLKIGSSTYGDINNLNIVVSPHDSNTVFAGSDTGLYKSTDGGSSWSTVLAGNTNPPATLFDRLNASVVFTGVVGGGVYKSTDTGESWVPFNSGLENSTIFRISQSTSGEIFASRHHSSGGIWKSANDTPGWENISDPSWENRSIWGMDIGSNRILVSVENYGIFYYDLGDTPPSAIPNPVIFVPGFSASWSYKGLIKNQPTTYKDWILFPVLSDFAYNPLIETLKGSGLEENKNLFTYAYDFRNSIIFSGEELSTFIDKEVLPKNPGKKVDIVGHSMGGLVARRCFDSVTGCKDKIGKVVTGGSPHLGALSAYLAWEGGVIDDKNPVTRNLLEITLRSLYPGNLTRKDIVQKYLPAVRDFLPIFDYISGKPYANMSTYGKNPNLEFNPITEGLSNTTLAYAGNGPLTYSDFITKQPASWEKVLGLWLDGKPISNSKAAGDGTVLKTSAEILGGTSKYFDLEHSVLLAKEEPLNELLDYFELSGTPVVNKSSLPESVLSFILRSPANITVKDSSSQIVGTILDDKVVFIRNPSSQIYTIELTGTDNGPYSLDAVFTGKIDDIEKIEGNIQTGQVKVHQFKFTGNSQSAFIDITGGDYYQTFLRSIEGITDPKVLFLKRVVEIAMNDIKNSRGRGAAVINLETSYLNFEDVISSQSNVETRRKLEVANEALFALTTQMNSLYGKQPPSTIVNANLKKAEQHTARLEKNTNPSQTEALNILRAKELLQKTLFKKAEGDRFGTSLLARGIVLL